MPKNQKPAWLNDVLPLNNPEVAKALQAVEAGSDKPPTVINDERVMAATFRSLAEKLNKPDVDCD